MTLKVGTATGTVWAVALLPFGQVILRKIIKIVATRCHNLWLKCTKFGIGSGWGFNPDPAGGTHSTLPVAVLGQGRGTSPLSFTPAPTQFRGHQ